MTCGWWLSGTNLSRLTTRWIWDLFGQVNAESGRENKHISRHRRTAGLVMGAYLSKGGKSFICLSSTMARERWRS